MTTNSVSPELHDQLARTITGGLESEYSVLRVWLRLLTCTTLIEHEVSGRLRSDFDTTLPRFDLMAQLARFPEGLGMGELSERLMVSGGNITGITDNLERDELVERITLPEDRRARKVRLTDKGRVAFDKMAADHKIWIEELLSSLTEQEQLQLYALLSKLKHGILTS